MKYFTPQQEALLKRLEASGIQKLQDQADDLRTNVKDGWRKKKARELDGADQLMVEALRDGGRHRAQVQRA